jgi:hypothetical protein
MTWGIYKLDSGLFTGVSIECGSGQLVNNVPDGCSCIIGTYDHLSQRVDLASGLVVDYIPPQPPDAASGGSYAWDDSTKRWLYAPSDADIALQARSTRHSLMVACDWTQGRDVPEATAALWAGYRQALRDVSKQKGFPRNIDWPIIPI